MSLRVWYLGSICGKMRGVERTCPTLRATRGLRTRGLGASGATPRIPCMMFRKRLLIYFTPALAALLAAVLASPSFALVKIDFDQRYLHEPNWVIKDHAVFKQDSLYHCFYTRGLIFLQTAMTCDSIGHATSTDLVNWTIHPRVIAVKSHTWENGAVWAPFVMEEPGGGYIMFYTGVDSNAVQKIGIATSPDLFTWTKHPGNPVFRPDTSWAKWDSLVSWSACRDPHIYQEDGTYYMFVTATAKNGNGAVGSAVSTDLFNWVDNGPVYVHSGVYPWHAIESVFLLKRNGKYRMFFSEQDTPPGVSYMASDYLYSGWSLGSRTIIDPGIAPEIVDDSGGVELITRFGRFMKGDTINYAVKIDTLRWVSDAPALDGPHPLRQFVEVNAGEAVFYQPTYMDNSYERGAEHANFQGNSWIGTLEYFQGPLQGGWAGWSAGENAKGYIKSYPFVVEGDSLSLLVGGGDMIDSAYVALYRASDDSLLYKETGRNVDTMDRRVWHVEPFKGEALYVKIVDSASGTWGHINCDEIEEFFEPPDTLAPSVQVLHPNGGEVLIFGTPESILWIATDDRGVDSVSIYYSVDGGNTFPFTIATGEPNDGIYPWTVPDTFSTRCVVKVVAYDPSMNQGEDVSDGVFMMAPFVPLPGLSPLPATVLALCLAGIAVILGRGRAVSCRGDRAARDEAGFNQSPSGLTRSRH